MQFGLRTLFWLMTVVAVSSAGLHYAQNLWGDEALGRVSLVLFLLCPLVSASVAWTCPGLNLTKGAELAGAVSVGSIFLVCILGWLQGSLLGAVRVTLVIIAVLWSPQVIIIYATVAYFGNRRPPSGDGGTLRRDTTGAN